MCRALQRLLACAPEIFDRCSGFGQAPAFGRVVVLSPGPRLGAIEITLALLKIMLIKIAAARRSYAAWFAFQYIPLYACLLASYRQTHTSSFSCSRSSLTSFGFRGWRRESHKSRPFSRSTKRDRGFESISLRHTVWHASLHYGEAMKSARGARFGRGRGRGECQRQRLSVKIALNSLFALLACPSANRPTFCGEAFSGRTLPDASARRLLPPPGRPRGRGQGNYRYSPQARGAGLPRPVRRSRL